MKNIPRIKKLKNKTLALKDYISLVLIFSIAFFSNACNREIRNYIDSKKNPIKVYIEPTIVEIDIYFLRSISSLETTSDKRKELIKKVSQEHAKWLDNHLEKILLQQGIITVSKDKADLILKPVILDMGEVRARKFFEGLSVGLVLGWLIGEMTGDPEIGLAVFVWEVIEEIIIVYLLKSYFMITTIDLTVKKPDGRILGSKEFTSYSNKEYEKNLPEDTRSLRENKVRGSLEKNAKDIAEFLSIQF